LSFDADVIDDDVFEGGVFKIDPWLSAAHYKTRFRAIEQPTIAAPTCVG
jgi:hypothetical protein